VLTSTALSLTNQFAGGDRDISSETENMKNKKVLGGFMIACSVFILGSQLLYTGFGINTITGLLLLVFGIAYVSRPPAEKKE
jgi:hypothetical protein